jgi:hypothetical protein
MSAERLSRAFEVPKPTVTMPSIKIMDEGLERKGIYNKASAIVTDFIIEYIDFMADRRKTSGADLALTWDFFLGHISGKAMLDDKKVLDNGFGLVIDTITPDKQIARNAKLFYLGLQSRRRIFTGIK